MQLFANADHIIIYNPQYRTWLWWIKNIKLKSWLW